VTVAVAVGVAVPAVTMGGAHGWQKISIAKPTANSVRLIGAFALDQRTRGNANKKPSARTPPSRLTLC
jgi:hypothetical protein